MAPPSSRPPRLAERLLSLVLPERNRDFILGDLAEEFADRAETSPSRARSWYWLQLLRSAGSKHRSSPALSPPPAPARRKDGLVDSLMQDLRYALRQLARSPGFTLVVVLTLALGIGANTAIVSVLNATLLKPLPYEDPERLVYVTSRLERGNVPATHVAPSDVYDMEQLGSLELAALSETVVLPFTLPDRSETVVVSRPTWNLFPMLGVGPALGRVFTPEDAAPIPDGSWRDQPLVISHALWRSSLGSDPSAMGRSVRLNGAPARIVGVLPEGFRLHLPPVSNIGADIDVFVPLRFDYSQDFRDAHFFRVVARVEEGHTIESVRSQLTGLGARLQETYDHHRYLGETFDVEPLQDGVVGPVRGTLAVFAGAVGFVLLIACANVANLLMARGTGRTGELAVRAALGAGRLRIVRQVLTESLVLALGGAVAGLLVAFGAISALRSLRPPDLPDIAPIGLDPFVLAATFGLALVASLLYGLLPAIQYARGGLGQRTVVSGRAQRRLQAAIAVGEVALSIVLLAGALLMLRSFHELQATPLGFDAENITAFRTNTLTTCDWTGTGFDCNRQAIEDEIERRLSEIPGVESVGIVFPLPMNGVYDRLVEYSRDAERDDERARREAYFRTLSPTYFETMGIELRTGRLFDRADNDPESDVPVVIVDDAFARREWPSENPIGKKIALFGWSFDRPEAYEVVGVVEYVPQWSHRDSRPAVYLPRKRYHSIEASVVVRATGEPSATLSRIERELDAVSPDLPLEWVDLAGLVDASMAPTRFVLTLLSAFSAMALLLSGIGLYGVVAYSVVERTRELGVRMAFGAGTSDVVRDVLRRGVTIALVGSVLGVLGAMTLTGLLERHLYRISPHDPLSLVVTAALVFAIAVAACLVPAFRAARVDPVTALRAE